MLPTLPYLDKIKYFYDEDPYKEPPDIYELY